MGGVRYVCPVCNKTLFIGLSDGDGEEQMIEFVCGVCKGLVRGTEVVYPPLLNDPVDESVDEIKRVCDKEGVTDFALFSEERRDGHFQKVRLRLGRYVRNCRGAGSCGACISGRPV